MFKYLLNQLRLEKNFIKEIFHFWLVTIKYNASNHTDDDMQKMQYTLLRENHTVEKGLSMRNPRKGFGKKKVINLMIRLDQYVELYGDKDISFLDYPLSTIKNYIDFTHETGVDITEIENRFNKLLTLLGKSEILGHAGIMEVFKEDILRTCNSDFESLLYSRHSIRYFTKEVVSMGILRKALTMAQRTPSACNRQGWMSHVFFDDKSIELMKWQEGCKGFEEEIRCSILVTADLKAFLSYEIHQAYIDGGLYAMNLINALHSLGLGTIPLSCGFYSNKLKKLAAFNIPENEIPILIIGIGHLYDRFNVAVSIRKDIKLTTVFHN